MKAAWPKDPAESEHGVSAVAPQFCNILLTGKIYRQLRQSPLQISGSSSIPVPFARHKSLIFWSICCARFRESWSYYGMVYLHIAASLLEVFFQNIRNDFLWNDCPLMLRNWTLSNFYGIIWNTRSSQTIAPAIFMSSNPKPAVHSIAWNENSAS